MIDLLLSNCHSIILMGAGLSAEDLGFESRLCVGTNSQSTLLAETWGLCLDPVMGICKGTFLGKLVTSLYAVLSWACVQYRWRCVSLEEKTHLETPGGKTPKLSKTLRSFLIIFTRRVIIISKLT